MYLEKYIKYFYEVRLEEKFFKCDAIQSQIATINANHFYQVLVLPQEFTFKKRSFSLFSETFV